MYFEIGDLDVSYRFFGLFPAGLREFLSGDRVVVGTTEYVGETPLPALTCCEAACFWPTKFW